MKIDFRTKFFLTIIIGVATIEGSIVRRYVALGVILALLPYLLALLDKKWSLVIKGLSYTGLAILAQELMRKLPINFWTMALNLYAGIVLRILPGVMMGYFTMTTTSMSDLVYSLKKIGWPDEIIIPVSVMFRFFYSIKEDYKKIKEAMTMHGLTVKKLWKDPMRLVEYKFVPLLMITSQTADHVAISAMMRGMKPGDPRSSISNARLRPLDFALLLFGVLVMGLMIRVRLC